MVSISSTKAPEVLTKMGKAITDVAYERERHQIMLMKRRNESKRKFPNPEKDPNLM
jgi:hypothetical protein